MIILDTNVIAEVMRGSTADPALLGWLRQLPESPVTTVVNRAEVMAGLRLLPEGSRRARLTEAASTVLGRLEVCLPLTPGSADRYGDIVARRRHLGRPVGSMDALVAAIALESDATVATRDVADFEDLGLALINPWDH